ncbi:inositol monophosphatase [Helicosporidium sp. ATCC 50920]|nr:inositol monophosphatase [Helicosporidium sp. ATCC 50920]|eukprot:KDD75655.1 inositol monophosphatase [Helicosporidium sp. ATCC 50920]
MKSALVDLDACMREALAAAQEAGAVMAQAWGKHKTVHHKGAVDLVTETDRECEALILRRLGAAFPNHAFIGEESSAAAGGPPSPRALTMGPTWMIDPLDGTTNFVHGFPFSCVSIGLVVARRPVLGVVHCPMLGETYTAVEGGGAFLNGAPIRCSERAELRQALFVTELGTRRDEAFLEAAMKRIRLVAAATRSMRAAGSCALNLCGVAAGRLDAYFEYGLGGPWDMAAGAVVLREAGGIVVDPSGARGGEKDICMPCDAETPACCREMRAQTALCLVSSGKPFNVMSGRVLGTNAHLSQPMSAILSACPEAPGEPLALDPLEETS